MKKDWLIKEKLTINIDDKNIKRQQIIKLLLSNRKLITEKQVQEFLFPTNPYLIPPQKLGINKTYISKAIARIKKAIDSKEEIVVYGDYDADGVTATAILWETLHSLKAKVLPFIPHREELGYGLKKEGIEEIIKTHKKPSLIITVDNGIVANAGVDYANSLGIDVIITDHHQPPKNLPKALSIIWSDKVSGSGVAWFVAKEISQYFHSSLKGFQASNALELAAIGTITDLMPVLGVNRSIIKFGLEELRKTKRPGILALCQETAIPQEKIGTYEIGYIIGPRLNAMGRLENALESLRLLCTNNHERARNLAIKLGLTNRARQQLTLTTFDHAKENTKFNKRKKILLIKHPSYNPGVIGLVAGKLVEEFYRPAIVIAEGKIYSKASVRSINGFNIIEALRKFEYLYEDLGGHPMAAGFTIKTANISKLEKEIAKLAEKELTEKILSPVIKIDLELNLSDIDDVFFSELEKFSPFGIGNPKPIFSCSMVEAISSRLVGRESQHLKIKLKSEKSDLFWGIGFNMGDYFKQLSYKKPINICFSVEKNYWNGTSCLQLIIKDIIFK